METPKLEFCCLLYSLSFSSKSPSAQRQMISLDKAPRAGAPLQHHAPQPDHLARHARWHAPRRERTITPSRRPWRVLPVWQVVCVTSHLPQQPR